MNTIDHFVSTMDDALDVLQAAIASWGYGKPRLTWVHITDCPLWHDGGVVGHFSGRLPAAVMPMEDGTRIAVVVARDRTPYALTPDCWVRE